MAKKLENAGCNYKPLLSHKLIEANTANRERGTNVAEVTNADCKCCKEAHSVGQWKCKTFLLS
jgi:hypothetical protein